MSHRGVIFCFFRMAETRIQFKALNRNKPFQSNIANNSDSCFQATTNKHFWILPPMLVLSCATNSDEFWKNIIRTGRNKLETILFVVNCLFLPVTLIYSSSEPQFVGVSAILKEEKTTPWWLIHEAVYNYANCNSSRMAVPWFSDRICNALSTELLWESESTHRVMDSTTRMVQTLVRSNLSKDKSFEQGKERCVARNSPQSKIKTSSWLWNQSS